MIVEFSRTKIICAILFLFSVLNAQTISGKVNDALLKTPLAGAKITVVELKKETKSDSTGHFKLDSLDKGIFSVRIEKENYLRQTKTIKLVALKGEAGSTDITLDVRLFALSNSTDQSIGRLNIQYFFPGHATVEINVIDSLGKVIRTEFDRSRGSGMRTFSWDGIDNAGKRVALGRYSCKIESGNLITTRTLMWKGYE